ncbi:protein of unknown function DUF456 [Alkaliphilus metalliredigens QYMF]|uniref:DUF456 domain-containing protein n=1 Tax=Alkaliphilus metalliredigens (strain QYMF) TaxID=293826 RepID=A6TU93_ALKMQ|nr:DUF456 domain-containing protein [Alkaliphilus metalliredigens]ABR49761.1 protein of unknown function DUF456 [Alkaliphilus metalliredigens QYMF]
MENIYLILSTILILLGVAGIFMPALPGPILVLAGVFLYSYGTEFTVITLHWLVIFGILTLFSIIFDYVASFFTTKKFGASQLGVMGMIIGGIIGFFLLSIIGLIIGQVIGTFTGEVLSGKSLKSSLRIGGAAFFGYVLSIVVNVTIIGIMIGLFVFKVMS